MSNTLVIVTVIIVVAVAFFFWRKNCEITCNKRERFVEYVFPKDNEDDNEDDNEEVIPTWNPSHSLKRDMMIKRWSPRPVHKVLPSMAIINSRCAAGGRCPCPVKGGNFVVCKDSSGRDMCTQKAYCP